MRDVLPRALRLAPLLLVGMAASAHSMQLTRLGSTLLLSGDVERRDLDRVQAEFTRSPAITHVVLRNSMGGNSWTGYRLGELFRDKGVTTVVSGHCISACSRLFLGGRERLFSDDYPASLTFVGFHGHYDFGKLNQDAVERNNLLRWTLTYTDHKADPALVRRWIAIERRAGDMRFYPPAVTTGFGRPTVLCQGTEPVRPQRCESINTTALAQGIVTTERTWSSPDADTLPYGLRRQRYPTTAYATLAQPERLPVRAAAAQREFDQFRRAAMPRAFAVSMNGAHWAWSANDTDSIAAALARCQSNGGGRTTGVKCVLYAVDDRVVYVSAAAHSPPATARSH